MSDLSRRSFVVRGGLSALILLEVFARRQVLAADAAAPVNLTAADVDTYCGTYRVDSDHDLGIDRFVLEGSGESVLLYSDYQSGVVRRLFPVSQDAFVVGPGFDTASPAELSVRVLRDERGEVAGVAVTPVGGSQILARRVPGIAEAVSFVGQDATLQGTLFLPEEKGPHPAIVLLHGSGALTRYSFGPYPHFFTSLGLAVLVYDKRGTGDSTGDRMEVVVTGDATRRPDSFYPSDLEHDALAALRFLKGRPEINPRKIGFWGSSEGGMLTTQVAAHSRDVAFAINSSGFMGPLWQTVLYQVEADLKSKGASVADIRAALDFTRRWLAVARTGKGFAAYQEQRQALLAAKKRWFYWWNDGFTSLAQMQWVWRHVLAFDPLPALGKVTCPVLGVFGERDLSTDVVSATKNMKTALSAAENKDFTVKIFTNAGHSLGEMPSGSRMAPGVFETLRVWLLDRIQ
jgi:pimeloyl-ACP methyl ester carboxylesterase